MREQARARWKEGGANAGWREDRGNNGESWDCSCDAGGSGEWRSKRRDKSSRSVGSGGCADGAGSIAGRWSKCKSKDWSEGGGGEGDEGANGDAAAGEECSRCGVAKLRLVRSRRQLEVGEEEALERALKRKRDEWPLDDLPLGPELLADVNTVLEQDQWDGEPSGTLWLKDWLREGVDWADILEERKPAQGKEYFCRACWQACCSGQELQQHKQTSTHRKRQRTWSWRFGVPPEMVASPSPAREAPEGAAGAASEDAPATVVDVPIEGASKAVAEILRKAAGLRASPAAMARRRLLEYRNGLSSEERQEIVRRIGLPRANDVANLRELQAHFDAPIAEDLRVVAEEKGQGREDLNWICREPTFSWLSGFYWHPEATSLEQRGEAHSEYFCHLCEVDGGSEGDYRRHLVTRRHAENLLDWAARKGCLDPPSHCLRCPDCNTSSRTAWEEERDLDLEHRRSANAPDPVVKEETNPPRGFRDVYRGDKGRVLSIPYLALVAKVDRRAHAVRLMSRIPIGPREKRDKYQGRKQDQRWFVELFWCDHASVWKTLAIPTPGSSPGETLDFTVAVQWSSSEKAPFEELDEVLRIQVPPHGEVAVLNADLAQSCAPGDARQGRGGSASQPSEVWVERKPVLEFVGRGQVEAAGGVAAMRGMQRPMQVATQDVMLSFLLWVPEGEEPRQPLVYFHGDMPRGVQQCPMPGIADFAPTYGPAQLVEDPKKKNQPVRDFVCITPCCAQDVWWLRYPAEHDAMSYAASIEACLRSILDLMFELGLSSRDEGTCFAGQSMGAYMALEIARAMPEGTAAVFAGAPHFDACRLNHLAERLVNVPLWILIGRNDNMCSFEEVASLALKMRDLDCKCVRLTSVGIKGHKEVGKKLERRELFDWLRNPLGSR